MDRMKKEKKEKRSILPGVIIVSLLVAAVVYAVLLNAEKTALSDYEKGSGISGKSFRQCDGVCLDEVAFSFFPLLQPHAL